MAVVAGCSSRPEVRAPASVLVVGDSITFQSTADVRTALRVAGWTVSVDGRPGSRVTGGYTIGSWPARLAADVHPTPPDVVVIELGTNGCGFCTTDAEGIDSVMATLREVPRVYWLNVRLHAPATPDPAAFNRALDAATSRWHNLHVIDMNGRFDDNAKLVSFDHTHLTTAGERVFADMIVHALPKVVG
ncbi:MAG TPA: GDSL-type esterase/lipase family protein [Acidimicrobiia bacterium]|nr:GDSL-type esterase/lipase family protein [Acidimicrobiia bacterium]